MSPDIRRGATPNSAIERNFDYTHVAPVKTQYSQKPVDRSSYTLFSYALINHKNKDYKIEFLCVVISVFLQCSQVIALFVSLEPE